MSVASERPSILIVDDHPPNLLALEVVLEPLGYEIVQGHSGDEALLKSLQHDFSLVFLDVHMPGLDGYQTAEMLRTRPRNRDVPILFITAADPTVEQVRRGYVSGATDFITKPFDPVVVRAKVAALVSLIMRGRREEQAHRATLDRLKDLFLGAIGHDLRNPLHAITMAARLVKEDPQVPEGRRRQLEIIERSALRMNAMVSQILDLTVEKFAGSIELKREAVDLASVCEQIVAEARSAHPERSITLEVIGDVTGEWDASRVARVVGNLVSNAIHHARESSVQIRLLGDGDYVSAVVRNDGPGIPPEFQPLLFEPFRRGKTIAEGFGLGLYIVREVTRAHGGDVAVRSSDAEGTTFIVTLPRKARRNNRTDEDKRADEEQRRSATEAAAERRSGPVN